MEKQSFNPILPSYEYFPDPEPHVFGDRVYIYGSHDRFNANFFCVNDYVCYSAPVNDLTDWKYEGVIYKAKKNGDPKKGLFLKCLFAPDCVQGPDGKFYLYYAYDFLGLMGVAVCDTPAGEYKYLGTVKYADGTIWGRKKGDQFPFDPGVLVDDDGRVYLYSGFGIDIPSISTGLKKLKVDGGVVVELEQDMVTMKGEPQLLFPLTGEGSWEGHEFFEASSIRKIDGKYVFVYSSVHNHELCYAESDSPMGGFEYKGVLVSTGDMGLRGIKDEKDCVNYLGNTHGGMAYLNGAWNIFYHRQTNRHSYSRQACAERLERDENGKFLQAEVTSCGLNGKPLVGKGVYEARIACQLYSKDGVGRYDAKGAKKLFKKHPYFTQTGKDRMGSADQYIANMQEGATAGFKYFDFIDTTSISMVVSGKANGVIKVYGETDSKELIAEIAVNSTSNDKIEVSSDLKEVKGKTALYFVYEGEGALNFHIFELK